MRKLFLFLLFSLFLVQSCKEGDKSFQSEAEPVLSLSEGFVNPPLESRPGVYWYFMDGNFSKEGITKDLEAMSEAGIGYVVFLEVNVGVPRGKVDFMSEEWMDIFAYIVGECRRLDIRMILGIGPGWTGSGGPWVEGDKSMRHLVSSSVEVEGGKKISLDLSVPQPHAPYFGESSFTPEMKKQWQDYYEDVAMLAFPAKYLPSSSIGDIDEKALFIRAPYSSSPGVKQYLPSPACAPSAMDAVPREEIIDLSGKTEWDAPEDRWVVMRFGCRNNGAATRPAPVPGVGMECDKFSKEALMEHLDNFTGKLFERIGDGSDCFGGVKYLHMDSWEMGAQNWSDNFRSEFIRRRGYDPQPFYPVVSGIPVENASISERFLWDLRLTSQELVVENHALAVRQYAHDHGCALSIEPYDMTPLADMELAVCADIPMAEFWSDGYGFNTSFAPVEGTSAAHLLGQAVVPAESFTSQFDGYRQYPGSIKVQTDWAFAQGINRLIFHTFQHQCLPDSLLPGMTMGPYGVHWDRNQTWWKMSSAYHRYVARCQFMLQRGRTQADILYLCPEAAPFVFRAPSTAMTGSSSHQPDRRGYNFDACPPSMLYKASVDRQGRICFPGGARYSVLVLPDYPTMTPELLDCIIRLVKKGAVVVGNPPTSSPSLENYPACDESVKKLAASLWGGGFSARGRIVPCSSSDNLYQSYEETASLLSGLGVRPDFTADKDSIRYTHRTSVDEGGSEIYFVSSRNSCPVDAVCTFRVSGLKPQLWDPMTGEILDIPDYEDNGSSTSISLHFEQTASFFIVFSSSCPEASSFMNTYPVHDFASMEGPWNLEINGQEVEMKELQDWRFSEDGRIRYHSGEALYRTSFVSGPIEEGKDYFLDLGDVSVIAKVKLNGVDAGIAWTKPYRLDVSDCIMEGKNVLEVEVANLWVNRLIGDDAMPFDGPSGGKWPQWLLDGSPRSSGRSSFSTWRHHTYADELVPSGLLGPVVIFER